MRKESEREIVFLKLFNQNAWGSAASVANTGHTFFTALQTVTQMNDQASTRHANLSRRDSLIEQTEIHRTYWMSHGDTSAMNVQFIIADTQKLPIGESYGTEGFVDLPHRNIIRVDTGQFQELTDSR